jgi:hypothetical protein
MVLHERVTILESLIDWFLPKLKGAYTRRTPCLHLQRPHRNIRPVMHSFKLNLFHHRIRLLSRFLQILNGNSMVNKEEIGLYIFHKKC